MSYILDALRRADAERERGHVPSLHTQPFPTRSPREATAAPSSPTLPWIIIVVLAAVVAVLGWLWYGSRELPVTTTDVARVSPVAAPPVAAPSAVTPATVTPAPVNVPIVVKDAALTPPPAAPKPAAIDKKSPPVAAKPPPKNADASTVQTTAPKQPEPPAKSTVASKSADPILPVKSELPADILQQLPPLVMTGSVQSPDSRKRMVIVDGKLVLEGEQAAPGTVIESIQPKQVIVRHKNLRFTVPL